MNLCRVCLGALIGVAIVNLYQYHNLEVVSNVVIDHQVANYVEYHFRNDPAHQEYGWHFCDTYVPRFQPRQIVDHIVYVREITGCENVAPYKASLKLVRVNGVPILDEGE
jgi:hypothetical protein